MSLFHYDADSHRTSPSTEEQRLPTRRSEIEPNEENDRESKRRMPAYEARRDAGKPRRWISRSLYAIAVVLVVAAVVFLGTAAWLRHSMRASLPQLDGDIHVAGLSGPVTVTRDAQGVPSIQAQTLDDLLFAQGFVTAQDRLWQMDSLRRHAAGELAEILGSKLVEHDRMQRTLRLRETAEQGVAALPPDQLHQLEAYARGVNAFIDGNSDHLPVEFHFLHYKPAPWTPRDSMLVSLAMFQDLATDFPAKMQREALAAHLPAQLLADLYPVGSWRDRPPTQPAPDLTTPKPEIQEIPLDDTQTKLTRPPISPRELLHVAHELPGEACDGCRSGSNNWAVAASRSASGFPLVSNDMHLSLSVPDIWYEAGLHASAVNGAPAFDVVGFTLPGAPFVIVGRNAHVAWGFTNLDGDVQDVRIEHTRGSGASLEYQKADGTWSPIHHEQEHIHVRGGRDVDFDVLTTTALVGTKEIKTPVISSLYPSEHRVLSLAWTPYDAGNLAVPFFAANSASDGQSLANAFANFGGPSLNLIYADDAKHIGYHALGRIPVRGPAQRSSRNLASPEPGQAGPTPPDNDEDQEETPKESTPGPDAMQTPLSGPHLVLAAYRPRRSTRRARRERPETKREAPAVVEAPIKAPPLPLNYTIGSAILPVPVDSLDASQQWSGYIPYDQLPAIVDPPNGILATANARITPADYPYFIANNWTSPYRAERIYKLLEGRSNLTPADMLTTQTDIHSEFDLVTAQRLAYALDRVSEVALKPDAKRLHQAADLLRAWDGTVSAESPAAAIVLAFRKVIWSALLGPQIAAHDHLKPGSETVEELASLYSWSEDGVALELLLQHTPQRWMPAGAANWNDFLAATLDRGLTESHAPSDLAKWRYGALHPVEIAHPVWSMSPWFDRILGVKTGSGRQQTGGDNTTVKAVGLHFGPSERFTADLADARTTNGNITTGQSANPASEWFFDQFRPWLEGTTFPLPLQGTNPTHTLRLVP